MGAYITCFHSPFFQIKPTGSQFYFRPPKRLNFSHMTMCLALRITLNEILYGVTQLTLDLNVYTKYRNFLNQETFQVTRYKHFIGKRKSCAHQGDAEYSVTTPPATWRRLVAYICRAAREAVRTFPPLANNTELDGCFSIRFTETVR